MSKKNHSTDSSPLKAPTSATSAHEPPIRHALRSLINNIKEPDNNHSQPPFQAPLAEIEHDGMIYSLFCRKKQTCAGFVELSPREKDIARMIATGLPNKTIAASLEISEWTVSTHLRRIFAKLGVSCRAAMVSKWLESHNQCKTSTDTPQPPTESARPYPVERDAAHAARDTLRSLREGPLAAKLAARI